MALQKGILKIEGTMGNMTFYRKTAVYLVKKKAAYRLIKLPMTQIMKEPVKITPNLVWLGQRESF